MKRFFLLSIALAFTTFGSVFAQNINNGLRIAPGTSGNGYVNLASLSLDTSDFTVETWILIDSDAYNGVTPFNDPSILGNKDWDRGTNQGLELAVFTGGSYKVNFTPASTSRVDLVCSGGDLMHRWTHIAATFERMGYIRLYYNGILTDSISIRSSHGKTIDASLPYNLCDDGTGAYAHPFHGNIDEFRVWRGVRTTAQIQQYMCRSLPASTPNLLVYLPMNQSTGTTVTDMSGASHNGTLTNLTASAWVSSGAPVGDSSLAVYSASFGSAGLNMSSRASGAVTVSGIGSGMNGIHVYRTNYAPNVTTGITIPGTDTVYFGVYPVSETATYNAVYDYTTFPGGVTYESNTNLYNRKSRAMTTAWTNSTATKSTTANTFTVTGASNYTQFRIGNLTTNVAVTSVTEGSDLSVYPNPVTNGSIHLNSNSGEPAAITVIDAAGRIVYVTNVAQWPAAINFESVSGGTYVLSCERGSKKEQFKIVVSH